MTTSSSNNNNNSTNDDDTGTHQHNSSNNNNLRLFEHLHKIRQQQQDARRQMLDVRGSNGDVRGRGSDSRVGEDGLAVGAAAAASTAPGSGSSSGASARDASVMTMMCHGWSSSSPSSVVTDTIGTAAGTAAGTGGGTVANNNTGRGLMMRMLSSTLTTSQSSSSSSSTELKLPPCPPLYFNAEEAAMNQKKRQQHNNNNNNGDEGKTHQPSSSSSISSPSSLAAAAAATIAATKKKKNEGSLTTTISTSTSTSKSSTINSNSNNNNNNKNLKDGEGDDHSPPSSSGFNFFKPVSSLQAALGNIMESSPSSSRKSRPVGESQPQPQSQPLPQKKSSPSTVTTSGKHGRSNEGSNIKEVIITDNDDKIIKYNKNKTTMTMKNTMTMTATPNSNKKSSSSSSSSFIIPTPPVTPSPSKKKAKTLGTTTTTTTPAMMNGSAIPFTPSSVTSKTSTTTAETEVLTPFSSSSSASMSMSPTSNNGWSFPSSSPTKKKKNNSSPPVAPSLHLYDDDEYDDDDYDDYYNKKYNYGDEDYKTPTTTPPFFSSPRPPPSLNLPSQDDIENEHKLQTKHQYPYRHHQNQQQQPSPSSSSSLLLRAGVRRKLPPTTTTYSSSYSNKKVGVSSLAAAAAAAAGSSTVVVSSPTTTPTKAKSKTPLSTVSSLSSPTMMTSTSTTSSLAAAAAGSAHVRNKSKAKTEMCLHWTKTGSCPFGSNCTYAHGNHELQTKTLADLQKSGGIDLDDISKYRSIPCEISVMVGSCPMGRRCASIHDPRVMGGGQRSWLPLTETQGNNLKTDINVDGLYQKRLHTVLFGNPFGEQFSVDFDDWTDLYKLVTNTTPSIKRRRNTISEVHKLSIALQMRGSHRWMYKYSPKHVILGELCMILQKRTFRLDKETGEAIPIPFSKFNAKNDKHVVVREIAFGPDADPTVRGVALWFNIPDDKITDCDPEVAKRFRWKKKSKFDDSHKKSSSSVFDVRECFFVVRPNDESAFDLATEMLKHRYQTVKAERLSHIKERFTVLEQLQKDRAALQQTFEDHKRHWLAWTFPIHNGRHTADDETPVPAVDAFYDPIVDMETIRRKQYEGEDVLNIAGSAAQRVWESFVSTMQILQMYGTETAACAGPVDEYNRLPIFESLSYGQRICPDRNLPHILTSRTSISPKPGSVEPKSKYVQQSDRCWQSILIDEQTTDEDGSAVPRDWGEVMSHFFNAKSKKVLRFVQAK